MIRQAAFFIFIMVVPASSFSAEMEYKGNVNKSVVDKAFDVVRQHCKPLLGKYFEDVKSVSAFSHEQYMFFDVSLKRNIQIDFEIKQVVCPKNIPPVFHDMVTVGHVCHISVYGGTKPGFLISKTVCQALCGTKENKDGSDVWVPVDDLRFIDPPV